MSRIALIKQVRVVGREAALLATNEPVDLLLERGRIIDIAPSGNLRVPTGDGNIIDGDGAWVIPGLWDHHVHTVQWALTSQREPLGDVGSAAEAVMRMAMVAPLGDGRRVGTGFRDALWPDAPTLELIDRACGDVPTYLINADVHSAWLNSAALRREGFSNLADDGVLREEQAFEISRRLNAADPALADAAVLDATKKAAARGIVGFIDFDMEWNASGWKRRTALGFDTQRVEFAIYPHDLERAISAGLRTGQTLSGELDDVVSVGSLKVIFDGSLGTRTAACTHGYGGDPANHGVLALEPAELYDLLVRATGAGIAVAVHAIGDRALSLALDAFGATGARGSIEHAQLARHSDLHRLARLGLAASVQPQHAMDDRDMADELWAEQTAIGYPLESLRAAGAPLWFGSDAPVAAMDPWRTISAAVHRTADSREPWHATESVSVDDALRASSWHGGLEGGVMPGARADLVLIGQDPSTASASELREMPVRATLLGGRVTFDAHSHT